MPLFPSDSAYETWRKEILASKPLASEVTASCKASCFKGEGPALTFRLARVGFCWGKVFSSAGDRKKSETIRADSIAVERSPSNCCVVNYTPISIFFIGFFCYFDLGVEFGLLHFSSIWSNYQVSSIQHPFLIHLTSYLNQHLETFHLMLKIVIYLRLLNKRKLELRFINRQGARGTHWMNCLNHSVTLEPLLKNCFAYCPAYNWMELSPTTLSYPLLMLGLDGPLSASKPYDSSPRT